MIRLALITSHLQKDGTYAACAVFDSMNAKEYKQLDSEIKKLIEVLNEKK